VAAAFGQVVSAEVASAVVIALAFGAAIAVSRALVFVAAIEVFRVLAFVAAIEVSHEPVIAASLFGAIRASTVAADTHGGTIVAVLVHGTGVAMGVIATTIGATGMRSLGVAIGMPARDFC
jgi:hypothetical protein